MRLSLVEGRRNPITGALVSARIVRATAAGAVSDQELGRDVTAFCRELLAPHKVPALVRVVDAIAVGEAGKIVRHHG